MIILWLILACGFYHADHHDGHHSHDHTHDPGVSSVSIVCEGSLDLEKVGFTCGLLNFHDAPENCRTVHI